jgi:DNA-binding transcriptional MerR regulator
MLMKTASRHRSRLRIGDVTRIFDLTPRAVRFYEEKGFVTAGRDQFNCRFYDSVAASRLQLISELRTAGLGLSDIRDVLTAEEEAADGARVAEARLAERRRNLLEELGRIDAISARLAGGPAASNDTNDLASSTAPRRAEAG